MAYFSNGSEGDSYEAHYCAQCVHQKPNDGGCMVMLAHILHNYDECNNKDSILHLLIPRSKNGGNEKCTMHHPKGDNSEPNNKDG